MIPEDGSWSATKTKVRLFFNLKTGFRSCLGEHLLPLSGDPCYKNPGSATEPGFTPRASHLRGRGSGSGRPGVAKTERSYV